MLSYKKRIETLMDTLAREQASTEALIKQLKTTTPQEDSNDEIKAKYRLLKKKLILANLELLKLKTKLN